MIVNVHYIDEKTGTIRSSGTYSYRTPPSEWRSSPPRPSARPAL